MAKGGAYENDSNISNIHRLKVEGRKDRESKRRIKWGWKKGKSKTESEDWSIFEEFNSCVNQKKIQKLWFGGERCVNRKINKYYRMKIK